MFLLINISISRSKSIESELLGIFFTTPSITEHSVDLDRVEGDGVYGIRVMRRDSHTHQNFVALV